MEHFDARRCANPYRAARFHGNGRRPSLGNIRSKGSHPEGKRWPARLQLAAVCEKVIWAGHLTSPPQAKNKSKGKTQKSKGKAAADIPFLSPKAKPLSFRAQRGIPPWVFVKERTRARFLAALGMTPHGNDPKESSLGFHFCDLRFAFCLVLPSFCVLPFDLFFLHLCPQPRNRVPFHSSTR